MKKLDKIFEYLNFLNEFRDVERSNYVTGTDRRESSMEHSYQLAMLGWYLIEDLDLDLDKEKVFKYCLTHDFVEVYSGDSPFSDSELKSTQKEREERGMKVLGDTLNSLFPKSFVYAKDSEALKDKESKFVIALDRLIPIINIYHDGGRLWLEKPLPFSLDKAIELKKEYTSLDDEVDAIFDELIVKLREKEGEWFV